MNEKELTYESAFPGRFLKAALFEGKHVTLTIEKAFMETLEGDKGKENKLVIAFEGKAMQLVCNKTNAFCLKEMFTNKIAQWSQKRVTFYPTETNFGPKKVDCIRVYGSPDIAGDIEVTARIGRKSLKTTLRKVTLKNGNGNGNGKAHTTAPATALDPKIAAAFGVLDWTPEERADYMSEHATATPAEILTDLNARIDARDSVEI
jgi:hypothetical protein